MWIPWSFIFVSKTCSLSLCVISTSVLQILSGKACQNISTTLGKYKQSFLLFYGKYIFLCTSNTTEQKSTISLCSRNFLNVKLRFDFVEVWWFSCHSDFTWNPIWVNSIGPKMSFLAILDSEFWIFSKFGTWKLLQFTKTKIQNVQNWQK